MSRRRGINLKQLMASTEIRDEIAKLGTDKALSILDTISSTVLKGYGPSVAETVPGSRNLVKLAVNYAFMTAELDKITSQEDRDWVLENSSIVVVDGARRLALTERARAQILDKGQKELPSVLDEERENDLSLLANNEDDLNELAGAYMRQLLLGKHDFNFTSMLPVHRRALTLARKSLDLSGRQSGQAPDLAELERQSALAELLDPLGMMIGITFSTAQEHTDRFVGRENELRVLRETVDVLGSESIMESLSRAHTRTRRSLSSYWGSDLKRMAVLTAPGGMGKSTLIAKFIMDHALNTERPFPFALLDFDRAALQPRNENLLFAEIARQVGLQFPDFSERLDSYRESIQRAQTAGRPLSLDMLASDLIRIVDEILNDLEADSFLLTLDTLELVQSDPGAIRAVASLLKSLGSCRSDCLCVVVSGRSGAAEITEAIADWFEITNLKLEPFTHTEAMSLVKRLGAKLVGEKWNNSWNRKIVGAPRDPPIRREPLTLRLAVEIVRDTKPKKRDELVEEIVQGGASAGKLFVGGLYQRRILDHINNEDAKKLAWPGLIARKVTLDIAEKLLAPICGLSRSEVESAFDLLSVQGWIVEKQGGVLHHRRDLRARTLPLMRLRDENTFLRVVDALIAYHSGPDHRDEIELAYYELLKGGEGLLDRSWSSDILAKLSDAQDDFEVGSDAWSLLIANNSRRPLPFEDLAMLPLELRWTHFARAGSQLRSLDDEKIDKRAQLLARDEVPPDDPSARKAWQNLQFKCGHWERITPDGLILPESSEDILLFALYANLTSHSEQVEPQFWARQYPEIIERIGSASVRKNWRAMALALPIAQLYDSELARHIDDSLAENTRKENRWRRSAEIGLREMMVCGERAREMNFSKWCQFEAIRLQDGISMAELRVALQEFVPRGWISRDSELSAISENNQSGFTTGSVETTTLAEAFVRLGANSDEADLEFARNYCQLRQPKWIVPLAYRIADLLPENWEYSVDMDQFHVGASGWFSSKPHILKKTGDVLRYLSIADRAGLLQTSVLRLASRIDTKKPIDIVRSFVEDSSSAV